MSNDTLTEQEFAEKYKDEPVQVRKWIRFAKQVTSHIKNYVIPQYGDEDNEPAQEYDFMDCVKQAKRYLARADTSQRVGEELRDLHKAAHWIQKAADRLERRQLDAEKSDEDRWANRRKGE